VPIMCAPSVDAGGDVTELVTSRRIHSRGNDTSGRISATKTSRSNVERSREGLPAAVPCLEPLSSEPTVPPQCDTCWITRLPNSEAYRGRSVWPKRTNEEYFQKRDRELIEQMRQQAKAHELRRLGEQAGVTDELIPSSPSWDSPQKR
jgi:hypothetical protein